MKHYHSYSASRVTRVTGAACISLTRLGTVHMLCCTFKVVKCVIIGAPIFDVGHVQIRIRVRRMALTQTSAHPPPKAKSLPHPPWGGGRHANVRLGVSAVPLKSSTGLWWDVAIVSESNVDDL